MRIKVLHNTHIKLKYDKIHNLILINKVISIVIIRPVIIVKIWNVNIYIIYILYIYIYMPVPVAVRSKA